MLRGDGGVVLVGGGERGVRLGGRSGCLGVVCVCDVTASDTNSWFVERESRPLERGKFLTGQGKRAGRVFGSQPFGFNFNNSNCINAVTSGANADLLF